MSLLRVWRAASRVASPGQRWSQPVEPAVVGAANQLLDAVGNSQLSGWLHARGFAGSSDGGGGSGGIGTKPAATSQRDEQEQQQQKQTSQEQPPREKQQEPELGSVPLEAAAKEGAAGGPAAAAGTGSGGTSPPGGESPPSGAAAADTDPPSFGAQHPDLHKYIAQLKELKGSTTVQRQQVGGETTVWQMLVQATIGKWLQGWIGDFIRARIETDFNEKEFVEGSLDAFWTVHQLMADEDWDTLKTLMSAKLFSAFKDTADAYKADGLIWRTTIGDNLSGGIRGMGFLTKEQVEKYDPALASLAPESTSPASRPTGLFLVITVQVKAEQKVTISRREDGQVVAELKDMRPMRWRFATGPLPGDLPADQLGTQWLLLNI